MSLATYNVARPNQNNNAGDVLANVIEEFTGMVEGTIQRRSATENFISVRNVKGTATVTNRSVGESVLGTVTPGTTPAPTGQNDFGKNSVTIDRVIYARTAIPLIDEFQIDFDARKEIANEHGKKVAKLKDEAFFVQGFKAANLAVSPYGSDGHFGGSVETLVAALDQNDPAKLYSAFARLFAEMEEKDVQPIHDGCAIYVRPTTFYTLLESEQVINGEYKTSDGTNVSGMVFKAWGVPVISTANLPNSSILEATAGSVAALMGANYVADMTKCIGLVMSPRAILAGQNLALRSDVFYDKMSKSWYVDAELAFAATPNRPEFSGVILAA